MAIKDNEEIQQLPHRQLQLLNAMNEHMLIVEYPADYFITKEWGLKLLSWCTLLGLTQTPDDVEQMFIVEALQNDFKGHSFAEIEVALKMCVMDEYSEPIEAYNKLNLRFLAKVMKAYRKFRKDVLVKYDEIKFKTQKQEPVVPTQFDVDISVCSQIWDDLIRIKMGIEVFALSYKAELLLKLRVLSSEETTKLAEREVRAITERDPDTGTKETRRRVRELQENRRTLDIYADNTAKSQQYIHWLNQMVDQDISGDTYSALVEAKIYTLHGIEKLSE